MPHRNRGSDVIFDDAIGASWILKMSNDEGHLALGPFTSNKDSDFMKLGQSQARFLGDLLTRHADVDTFNPTAVEPPADEEDYGRREEDREESSNEEVVDFILEHGGIDGGHHKQWVLDQVLRQLLGDSYEETIEQFEMREGEWDIGVEP